MSTKVKWLLISQMKLKTISKNSVPYLRNFNYNLNGRRYEKMLIDLNRYCKFRFNLFYQKASKNQKIICQSASLSVR